MLRVIWIEDVLSDGVGDNLLYEDLTEIDWRTAEEVLIEEKRLLDRVAKKAADADEFEQLVDRELAERRQDEEFDEGPLSPFAALDLGVMSAVATLSAAGCATTTSCRGHRVSGEPNPLVRFTTDEARLPLIRKTAQRAGCGLLLDQDGMLQLYARNVLGFIAFAQQMLRQQETFDAIQSIVALPRPQSTPAGLGPEIRRSNLAKIFATTDFPPETSLS